MSGEFDDIEKVPEPSSAHQPLPSIRAHPVVEHGQKIRGHPVDTDLAYEVAAEHRQITPEESKRVLKKLDLFLMRASAYSSSAYTVADQC
jgi:hypothetical protein